MILKHFFYLSLFCIVCDIPMDSWNFSAVFHKFSLYFPRFNVELLLGNAAPGDASRCSCYFHDIFTVGHDVRRSEIKPTAQQSKRCFVTRGAVHVWRNSEACSCKPLFRGKATSITYTQCMCVALIAQHAKRMRRAVLSSVVSLALQHFSNLIRKRHDFRGKVVEHKTCVLIFSIILSKTFLILRRIQRGVIVNVCRYSCNVPVILVSF